MYQQTDYDDICAQRRGRILAVCLPAGALLALALTAFFLRWPQAVTIALTVAACSVMAFGWNLFVSPLSAYRKHIEHALNGRTSKTEGVFVSFDDDLADREGMPFWPMTINVGAGLRDDGNRLFYYDGYLAKPDLKPGEALRLTSFDNRVTAWERIQIEA